MKRLASLIAIPIAAAGITLAGSGIASAATHGPNVGVHANTTTAGSDVYMHT